METVVFQIPEAGWPRPRAQGHANAGGQQAYQDVLDLAVGQVDASSKHTLHAERRQIIMVLYVNYVNYVNFCYGAG
jgi:hypothetical protein